jgi:hypothetical protein
VETEYGMTVHDLPEAMLDRLAARCSNAGRWGSSDCMGTLTKQLTGHLFITQQLPKQAQPALAGLRIPVVTHRGSGPPTHRDVVTGAPDAVAIISTVNETIRIVDADRFVTTHADWHWGPDVFLGWEVSAGTTLGIVGMGRIGFEMTSTRF